MWPTGETLRAKATGAGHQIEPSLPLVDFCDRSLARRATLVGDVNRDRKADLIAVDDNNTYVRLSTGSGFGPVQGWSGTPFYGSRGSGFGPVQGWSGAPFYGS